MFLYNNEKMMTYTDAVHLRKRVEFPKLRMETTYLRKPKSGMNQKKIGKITKYISGDIKY